MTKRLFSLAMICFLAVTAWAVDVTSSQKTWTFDNYTSQTASVYNYDGIYLHASGLFNAVSEHIPATSGTFSGSSESWSVTKVLVCQQGVDSKILSLGNVEADSEEGPDGSLAINYSGAGRLHIVYGATSETDGTFYIRQKQSSATTFSTLYEKEMEGMAYTGVLGTRSSEDKYTLVETAVDLSGSGTVYLGGTQPYCIYAILFEPASSSIYGVYDFRAMATENVSGTSGTAAINLIDRAETPNGSNTDISGKVTDNGAISIVYRKKSDGASDFKWGKSENAAETGIMMPRGGRGELSFFINGLKAGDWFKIETGDKHLLFYSSDFYDLNEGASSSVKSGDSVESGHTYVAKKDVATLQLYYDTKQSGYLYIYSVEISNGDAVPAPVISDYDFDTGKVTMTVADSYKGNTPAIYYGIDDAEPTTLYTGPFTVAKACTVKAIAKVGELKSTVTKKDIVLEVVSDPVITFADGKVTITGGSSNAGKSTNIYYTLDASQPTTSSTKYTGAIAITETRIVKAISISTTGTASNVVKEKAVVDQATPSTIWDFINDAAMKPLVWNTEDKINQSYFTSSNAQNSNFLYITNAPIHGQMTWLTPDLSKINATTDEGTGLKVVNDGRPFTISDLHEGDAIYITYTTTGDKLKTSKHSSIGNTVTIGTTDVTSGQTEIESGAKIVVKTVDASNNYVAFMPNKNITIQSIAINPRYAITATAEHGSISVISPAGTDLSTATFAPGDKVTLQATGESSDWVFSHWVVNGTQDTETTLTLTMDGNKTVEAVFSKIASTTGVPVILVAGQSNTDGRIQTAFPYTLDHTMLSYCNGKDANTEGVFTAYGTTPRSDSGERWGYDAVVYDKIQTMLNGEDFYVVKESMGNTAINSASTSGNGTHFWSASPVWLDRNTSANQGGRSLLKGFFGNIDKSLKALTDGGKAYDIKFLMWHQGEADRGGSFNPEYEKQLKAVINELRNYLVTRTGNNKYSKLPVILGGISTESSQYNATVEQAKQNLADADANIYYVPATGIGEADLNADNQKVHFGAESAQKFGGFVWDVITSNNLMTGITLSGTDTPAENPLVEDVVSTTTLWAFDASSEIVANQSINGLYPHGGSLKNRGYEATTLADGTTVEAAYAVETSAADRKNNIKEGLTAGNSAVTNIYSVNVAGEGTFIALIKPQKTNADYSDERFARLMLNGEELQAVSVASSDYIQLVGKTSEKGTFAVTCGATWDLVAAKFIAGATTIEVMTPPTIGPGSEKNTVRITPGTSDQADATLTTYYTTDGNKPSAASTPYSPGTDITLTADCVVKAVTISSKGGEAYSAAYDFQAIVDGQTISPSTLFQTYTAEKALNFTNRPSAEAYIVVLPAATIGVGNEEKDAESALTRAEDTEVVSDLQLLRVYQVPKGTAFLVKYTDKTAGDITVPYLAEDISVIKTATETIETSKNLLAEASKTISASDDIRLFEADATGEAFSFNETKTVDTGNYYLNVPSAAVGENTVSLQIVESTATPYLIEVDTYEISESAVYDFAAAVAGGDVTLTKSTAGKLSYLNKNGAVSGPSSFDYLTNDGFGGKRISVRGFSDWTLNKDDGGLNTPKDDRQLAIHDLKKGDGVRIVYEGGTLKYATVADKGDAASVLGKELTDLDQIGSKAKITVTQISKDDNYLVLYPSTDCVIKQIYINPSEELFADYVAQPMLEFKQVTETSTEYTVYYEDGCELSCTLNNGSEGVSLSGRTITVTKTGTLKVTATKNGKSSATELSVKAPTPAIATDGVYNFSTLKSAIGTDYQVYDAATSTEVMTVGEVTLYSPDQYTKKTFDGKFAFSASKNWLLRNNGTLRAAKSSTEEKTMAILNVKKGQYLWIEYTTEGGPVYSTESTASLSASGTLSSATAYQTTTDGYLILTFPTDTDCQITKISITYSSPTPTTKPSRPSAAYTRIEEGTSIYTLKFSAGSTLHYTLPGGNEQTVTTGTTAEIKVTTTGMLSAYATSGELHSDTLSTRVYAPTPAIEQDGLYDFSTLNGTIGADYTLGNFGWGEEVTVGGLTLNKPDDMMEKTLDRFAFGPAMRTNKQDDGTVKTAKATDWRLLGAGRLRATRSDMADTMAVLNLKKGQYLTVTYSGALVLMKESAAKLAEGTDTLKTQQAYEILADGHLLLCVPDSNAVNKNCDITQIEIASTERVTPPTISERVENGEVVPNKVTIRLGTSSFGKKVTAYYTTDGSAPTTKSTALDKNTTISVGKSCTVKAYCVSETGVYSDVASYVVDLEASKSSPSVVYDLLPYVQKNDTIAFGKQAMEEVYNAEYTSSTGNWDTKRRTDFMPVTDFDSKVSVRNGYKSLTYDNEAGTIRLTRAMAIHNLGIGDEIIIIYKGDGTLYSAYTAEADAFTVDGAAAPAGTKIPSGAVIKVTETMYGNNYIVVTPTGDKSGKVFINAIYINHAAPDMVREPVIAFDRVDNETAIYQITFDKGSTLHYILKEEGSEMTSSNANGIYELPIEKGDSLTMWATRSNLTSDIISTIVFAPTPAPMVNGNYDMTEASEELPADMEVILDPKQEVIVDGETLYKPNALTASTFEGRFAFTETNTANKIRLRKNRQLVFNKGTDMSMAILNLKRGDIVAFEYTGSIVFENTSMLRKEQRSSQTRAGESLNGTAFESGEAYVVQSDGDILLKLQLKDASVNITKMYIAPVPASSTPVAIDFASANEEYETLERGTQTGVWLNGDKSARQFVRFTNNSNNLPIDGKLSMEANAGELTNNGITGANRHLVIHNLSVGDTIRVRFYGGGLSFDGHETKGNRISIGDHRLSPTDSISSGDVIVVDKVDYLNNYVVLKLDKGCAVSALYINKVETEKVWMPTLTDKGKNIVLIKAGRSSVGKQVTTCYTTDGSEPTRLNGTSGPYEEFDVEFLGGGEITIKAVSYTDNGVMSKVASITIFAEDILASKRAGSRGDNGIFDMNGNKVNAMQSGKIYIRDGRVVFFGR